ncbi:MAG: ATP-binding protein [Bacteroidetes bacterium]|nr:ATP-binding protein [Bacteroidota bacterium]
MSHYIKRLIEQGEHQKLDFKFEIADSRKIAKSLVAFSNSDGGTLLIGVKDNGAIAGVRSDEEFFMVEAAAKMYSRPEVRFTTREWEIEGKTVVEVIIPKSDSIPHYAQDKDGRWLVYIRVKDQNLLANNVLLKVWEKHKQKQGVLLRYTEKEKWLLDYLEENGQITLSKFYRLAKISRKKAETILVNLVVLKVIEMIFTDQGVLYRMTADEK